MAISDDELHGICEAFTESFLEKRSSKGMCAVISWALQGYLSYVGLKTKVYEGDVGRWNHLWLQKEDGTVIDCTADQFNRGKRKLPRIYIGKPLSIHNGKEWRSK